MSGISPHYPDVDVSTWELLEVEPMGSKPNKLWLLQPVDPEGSGETQARWLFKPRTHQRHQSHEFPKGDDWAEKLAGEIALVVEVPSAAIELARRETTLGIVSADVSGGRDLVLGNEVLFQHDPDYPVAERHGVPDYSVCRRLRGVAWPRHAASGRIERGAGRVLGLAGYLVLHALIGNTDRHHENWGVLVGATRAHTPTLAPTFDHASSLGFLLSDEERAERLVTTDHNRTVEAYARRGRSRHFAGEPGPIDLAVEAVTRSDGTLASAWARRLSDLDDHVISQLLDRIPEPRMSRPSRIFVTRLLAENRRRLLDALDRAR